ncbi:hypothetical protein KSP35_02665 [Aquihabitans sp. G128]|uniref:hypothetical protein n=1 Tax=Aquihabitans sp. G128 TaxID=2849779 RepID=UPI001C21AFDD|nr:hypothetical protein [Aquihabitans sp. G128]QXC61764.1 hypothetical protein KSP35_02665 [Aquihabitans sp. G128]
MPDPPKAKRAAPVPKGAVRKAAAVAPVEGGTVAERREARQSTLVRDLPARVLARELEKRGWILIPPEELTAEDPTAAPPEA